MTRLIDADALKEDIERFYRPLCDGSHMKDFVLNQILTDIGNEVTVEASPVIYCKDCMYQKKHKAIFYCDLFKEREPLGEDNQFCSNARRRSNE